MTRTVLLIVLFGLVPMIVYQDVQIRKLQSEMECVSERAAKLTLQVDGHTGLIIELQRQKAGR